MELVAAQTTSQNFRMLISTRQCLAYAAATGYRQAEFVDDAAQPVRAAPGFPVCLEWPLHSASAHFAPLGITAEERKRSVHAWQDTRQFAPIVAGRHVDVRGALVQVVQARSGLKLVSRYDTLDAQTSALLATTHTGVVLRGVVRDQLPREALALQPEMAAPRESDAVEEIALERLFPHVYSECTGIWNPIHTERAVALAQGLPDIIVHGSAMWAVIGRVLLDRFFGAEAIADHSRLYAAFRAPVVAGEVLRVQYRHESRHEGHRASYWARSGGVLALEGFVEW